MQCGDDDGRHSDINFGHGLHFLFQNEKLPLANGVTNLFLTLGFSLIHILEHPNVETFGNLSMFTKKYMRSKTCITLLRTKQWKLEWNHKISKSRGGSIYIYIFFLYDEALLWLPACWIIYKVGSRTEEKLFCVEWLYLSCSMFRFM